MCELMNPLNENTITKYLTSTEEINEIYFCPLFCGGETYANTPPLVSHPNDPLNQDFQFWMCCTREVNAVCLPPDGSQLWKAESSFRGRAAAAESQGVLKSKNNNNPQLPVDSELFSYKSFSF